MLYGSGREVTIVPRKCIRVIAPRRFANGECFRVSMKSLGHADRGSTSEQVAWDFPTGDPFFKELSSGGRGLSAPALFR